MVYPLCQVVAELLTVLARTMPSLGPPPSPSLTSTILIPPSPPSSLTATPPSSSTAKLLPRNDALRERFSGRGKAGEAAGGEDGNGGRGGGGVEDPSPPDLTRCSGGNGGSGGGSSGDPPPPYQVDSTEDTNDKKAVSDVGKKVTNLTLSVCMMLKVSIPRCQAWQFSRL